MFRWADAVDEFRKPSSRSVRWTGASRAGEQPKQPHPVVADSLKRAGQVGFRFKKDPDLLSREGFRLRFDSRLLKQES